MLKDTSRRLLVGLGAVALVAACTTGGGATTAPAATTAPSRPPPERPPRESPSAGQRCTRSASRTPAASGNGFREEQICTAKAEALASGQVATVDMDPRRHGRGAASWRTSATLIAATRTRSSSTRTTRTASTPALEEAQAAGIMTVAVDAVRDRPGDLQPLQQPGRLRLPRRQVAVRAARRQGQGLLHARPRRPPGRRRPPRRASRRRSPSTPASRSLPNEDGVAHRVGPGDRDQR